MENNVSWPPRSNDRFCIWKYLLNHIWFTEALNRPQKSPNMVPNGKFAQPYILVGSFLTKTNGFLTRRKITWVNRNIPTILWKYFLNHTWVTEVLNRPQKRPHIVLIGKFSQPYSPYPVWARASGVALYPLLNIYYTKKIIKFFKNYVIYL